MKAHEIRVANCGTLRYQAGAEGACTVLSGVSANRPQRVSKSMVHHEGSACASSLDCCVVDEERTVAICGPSPLARPESRHVLAERLVATRPADSLVLPLIERAEGEMQDVGRMPVVKRSRLRLS